jgi:hypothetical protein
VAVWPFSPYELSRQRELKNGTVWTVRSSPQSSVMSFNDRAADRQPHPQAVRLGRVEGLEQVLGSRWRQARTRQATIPPEFWAELKRQSLVDQNAPTPGAT